MKIKFRETGPMSINHGNLFNKILALVQGCCRVLHDKVNGTGVGVVDRNGTTIRAGRFERNRKEEVVGGVSAG